MPFKEKAAKLAQKILPAKQLKLRIDFGQGVLEKEIRFKPGVFGKARLLDSRELPGIAKGYEGTLLHAVWSSIGDGYQIEHDGLGFRLVDEKTGEALQYHFEIEKNGGKWTPFALDGLTGKSMHLDLRNTALCRILGGKTISVHIGHSTCDNANSHISEIIDVFTSYSLHSLDSAPAVQLRAKKEFLSYEKFRSFMLDEKWLLKGNGAWKIKSSFPEPNPGAWQHPFIGGKMPNASRQDCIILGDANASGGSHDFRLQADEPAHFMGGGIAWGRFWEGNPHSNACLPTLPSQECRPGSLHKRNQGKRARKSESQKPSGASLLAGFEGKNQPEMPASFHKPVGLPAKGIKAAVFDLDGVVVHSEKEHRSTFNKALSRLGIRLSKRYWEEKCAGRGSNAVMETAFADYNVKESVSKWASLRSRIYEKYLKSNRLSEVEGLSGFLSLLARASIPAIIASSGERRAISLSLKASGIKGLDFVGKEDVRKPKPSPELFILAAKRLGAKPYECVAFEDSLAGVEAAARAGMPCIALSTTLPQKALWGKAALVVQNFRSKRLSAALLPLLGKEKRNVAAGKMGPPAGSLDEKNKGKKQPNALA